MIPLYLNILLLLIPILMGIFLRIIYGKGKLLNAILLFSFIFSLNQLSVYILYLINFSVNKEIVLFTFRALSFAPIFILPLLLYICYLLIKQEPIKEIDNKPKVVRAYNIYMKIFNKTSFVIFFVVSFFVFLLSITDLGFKDLKVVHIFYMDMYYPVSGKLAFLLQIHAIFFLLLLLFSIFVTYHLESKSIRNLLQKLLILSFFLFLLRILSAFSMILFVTINFYLLLYVILVMLVFLKYIRETMHYNALVMNEDKNLESYSNVNSYVAHRVRNDLAIILGYLEILKNTSGIQPELLDINEESLKLNKLVLDHRKFMKYDINISPEIQDIKFLIIHAVEVLQTKIEESKVEVELADYKYNIFTSVDSIYIFQCFVSLFSHIFDINMYYRKARFMNVDIDCNDDIVQIDIKYSGKVVPTERWKTYFHYPNKSIRTPYTLAFCNKVILLHRGTLELINSTEEENHIRILLPRDNFNNII